MASSPEEFTNDMSSTRRRRWPIVLLAPIGVIAWETWRWVSFPEGERAAELVWLALSAGPYVLWFLLLPIVILLDRSSRKSPVVPAKTVAIGGEGEGSIGRPLLCFLVSSLSAFLVTASMGWSLRSLPPLYHDEYSYAFQAWTFLSGRLSYPVSDFAPYFDQMHVLNHGIFAGRYFPGTALWLTPFAAFGVPVVGMWISQSLVAGFVSLAAFRHSAAAGYLAGLSVAVAPALIAMSNMLLSPHPTMLGMAIFLWAYPKAVERRSLLWPIVAGFAIGFAFLCRPLTAVGLGLPFALHALWVGRVQRTRLALLIVSFGLCVLTMALYNQAQTGSPLQSPYGVYLERHTPSHVYGFGNRSRGEKLRGPDTLTAYDDWAEEHTFERALRLTKDRWGQLVPWSVGWQSLLFCSLTAIVYARILARWIALPMLGIAGLTLAYFPYAFPGVLGFGYLIESIPWICFVLGIAVGHLATEAARARQRWLTRWWLFFPIAGMLWNVFVVNPAIFADGSELVYPRREAAHRRDLEKSALKEGPILVLIDADPGNAVHSTYVYNRPTLDGPVVRAWLHPSVGSRPEPPPLSALLARYSDRDVYVYRPPHHGAPESWSRIRERAPAIHKPE